jgi:hypothetical protein
VPQPIKPCEFLASRRRRTSDEIAGLHRSNFAIAIQCRNPPVIPRQSGRQTR